MQSKAYNDLEIASNVISDLIDTQIALLSVKALPTEDRIKAVHLGECACEVQYHLINKRIELLKEAGK